MNKNELDAILKRARTPEIPPESLELFPLRVIASLKRSIRPRVTAAPRLPIFKWALGLALSAILLIMIVEHRRLRPSQTAAVPGDVLMNAKLVRGMLAMFPNHLRAIVEKGKDMDLVLSDDASVPANGAMYVKICGSHGCTSMVTFSGQEIQIDGQSVTVLSDGIGGIIVTGNEFVWSSSGSVEAGAHPNIEARNLNIAAL